LHKVNLTSILSPYYSNSVYKKKSSFCFHNNNSSEIISKRFLHFDENVIVQEKIRECSSDERKSSVKSKPKIGIALGSGTAKGWAHIGIIRGLEKHGIIPDVVSGTSIGALVGGAYAADKLHILESFAKSITWRDYVALFDLSLLKMNVSGLMYGDKIVKRIAEEAKEDLQIENLKRPFGAIATDLRSGKEIWITKGSLIRAIRSSIAMPGLLTPVQDFDRSTNHKPEWLVDGALVNPLPISVCRALGADIVIAVNLHKDIVVKNFPEKVKSNSVEGFMVSNLFSSLTVPQPIRETASSVLEFFNFATKNKPSDPERKAAEKVIQEVYKEHPPHIIKVILTSINIMQHRIMAGRLATDPPEVELAPSLTVDAFDFDNATQAIAEGMKCIDDNIGIIEKALQRAEKNERI